MSAPPPSAALKAALDLHRAGRLAEAEAAYRQRLRDAPQDADALHLLGLAAHQQGRGAEGADAIAQAIALAPDRATFPFNLGTVCLALGRLDEAETAFLQAVALDPKAVEAWVSLATLHGRLERFADGASAFERALALAPDHAVALSGLSACLKGLGRTAEARDAAERAVAAQPSLAEAHQNLGNAYQALGQLARAEAGFREAARLAPANAQPLYNLANLYMAWGRLDDAVQAFDGALARNPDHEEARGNRLLCRLYREDETEQSLFEAHAAWGEAHPAPPRPAAAARGGRPLRVGYVSPDFRRHSCAYFIEPVLAAHDPTAVRAFCYANVAKPDAVTARLRGLCADWRDIKGQAAGDVARQIRADGIDVLVDLAGHTSANRLDVFALRPAPVQVSWLGYPATTGLAAMDWRITDATADPPGDADRWHGERLYRLPAVFHCYRPPQDAPAVSPLPARETGRVTFGSFNNLAKVTGASVAAWAAILHAVPDARLVLKGRMLDAGEARDHYAGLFAGHGIDGDRLVLRGWIDRDDNPLAAYHDIDIGLDPFPYNGTTTTCEALWMGVPVITLAGRRHAARVGASLARAVGRPQWIAADAEDYVRRAVALAGDLDGLAAERATLRATVAASPLRDEAAFARALETAYRSMADEAV